MQPKSALANQRKKVNASKGQVEAKVTEAQSKDIMANLLGELDQQDEDDLQDVTYQAMATTDLNGAADYEAGTEGGDQQVAFNKDDQLTLKYNATVGQIQDRKMINGAPGADASKKRGYSEISN